ncbi:Uncharacterised protein [Janthinobacterium lividum]|nr:Uncharacterised protein [Janthinobacterium lividum]
MPFDDPLERTNNAFECQREIDFNAKPLTVVIVYHVKQTNVTAKLKPQLH